MKVITASEMKKVEEAAFQKGADPKQFMLNAGRGVALFLEKLIQKHGCDSFVSFFAGKGNNGGDAYVAACLLQEKGIKTVVQQLGDREGMSTLCRYFRQRYELLNGIVHQIEHSLDEQFPKNGVICDGLFGTGFRGAIQGKLAAIIERINESGLPIVAIDIPSGVQGNTGHVEGPAVIASHTVCMGLPKMGFFLDKGWNYVGELCFVDFGLDQEFVEKAVAKAQLLDQSLISPLLPTPCRQLHKYKAGVLGLFAGSVNMPGAAILAAKAAMRTGCGLVRLSHRPEMELSQLAPEVVRSPYLDVDQIRELACSCNAFVVGPGLGRDQEMGECLEQLIPRLSLPSVVDADALYWQAELGFTFSSETVITPHMGEMKRLLGTDFTISEKGLKLVQEFSRKENVCTLLKGAPSWVFFPGELPLITNRGDPGMATAGSGDVLSGMIGALLAQGIKTREAAALGAYLHGIAGELAAKKMGSRSVMASDITESLGFALQT